LPAKRLELLREGLPNMRTGRSPDWIKVKNPDAPATTRVTG